MHLNKHSVISIAGIHSNAHSNYYFWICLAAFFSGGFIVTRHRDKSKNISAQLAGVVDLEVDTRTFCTCTEASRRLLGTGRQALEAVKGQHLNEVLRLS